MKRRFQASGSGDPAGEDGEEAGHARVWEPAPLPAGILSPENRHHLERVLRLRAGGRFQITDGRGGEADAMLESDGRYRLAGPLRDAGREPVTEVSLYISLIKGDRFETVIEKAVELGVSRIVPVVASRCVARPPAPGKLERWRKIALAAMLQCGGCRVPEVADPVGLQELGAPPAGVRALVLHESRVSFSLSGLDAPLGGEAGRGIPGVPYSEQTGTAGCGVSPAAGLSPVAVASQGAALPCVWILSGPEGGFSDDEIGALTRAGWQPAWLGPRRLRADTAPIAAASLALLVAEH